MKRGRKGQISIFIIIGIVIIIGVFVFIFLRSNNTISIENVPDELLPVNNYIENCLESVSRDAIMLAGVQGGYTTLPPEIINNPEGYINTPGTFKVPYWYLKHHTKVPTTFEISRQLAIYVNQNIEECLAGFAAFNDSYTITPTQRAKTDVFIKDSAVEFALVLPLDVEGVTSTGKLKNFRADLPVRLGRILRLARALMDAENKKPFIEKNTIDLMATMPDSEIPFTSISFRCLPHTWGVSGVKEKLQDVLKYNIPRLRVMKTDFIPFERELEYYESLPNNEPLAGDIAEYSMFRWDPLSEIFDNMKVGLAYMPEWGMDLTVSPSNGNEMKSTGMQGGTFGDVSLVGNCIQFYHFTYDVEYPVRLSIYDMDSLENGYSFSFAFPVIIQNNRGVRNYDPIRDLELTDTNDFCSDLGSEQYSIFVQDKKTYHDLEETAIKYHCLNYMCDLGTTGEDSGRLVTNLPEGCFGGVMVAEKNGYLKTTTNIGDSQNVNVYMRPLHDLNVTVLKYNNETDITEELVGLEKASVYFTTDDQELFMVYDKKARKLGFIESDANYTMNVYLFLEDKLIGGYKGNFEVEDIAGKTGLTVKAYYFPDDPVNLINEFENTMEPVTI